MAAVVELTGADASDNRSLARTGKLFGLCGTSPRANCNPVPSKWERGARAIRRRTATGGAHGVGELRGRRDLAGPSRGRCDQLWNVWEQALGGGKATRMVPLLSLPVASRGRAGPGAG